MNNYDVLFGIVEMALEALLKERANMTPEQLARLDDNFADYQNRIARAEAAAAASPGGMQWTVSASDVDPRP